MQNVQPDIEFVELEEWSIPKPWSNCLKHMIYHTWNTVAQF